MTRKKTDTQSGFTLIETLIGLVCLGLVVYGFAAMNQGADISAARADKTIHAVRNIVEAYTSAVKSGSPVTTPQDLAQAGYIQNLEILQGTSMEIIDGYKYLRLTRQTNIENLLYEIPWRRLEQTLPVAHRNAAGALQAGTPAAAENSNDVFVLLPTSAGSNPGSEGAGGGGCDITPVKTSVSALKADWTLVSVTWPPTANGGDEYLVFDEAAPNMNSPGNIKFLQPKAVVPATAGGAQLYLESNQMHYVFTVSRKGNCYASTRQEIPLKICGGAILSAPACELTSQGYWEVTWPFIPNTYTYSLWYAYTLPGQPILESRQWINLPTNYNRSVVQTTIGSTRSYPPGTVLRISVAGDGLCQSPRSPENVFTVAAPLAAAITGGGSFTWTMLSQVAQENSRWRHKEKIETWGFSPGNGNIRIVNQSNRNISWSVTASKTSGGEGCDITTRSHYGYCYGKSGYRLSCDVLSLSKSSGTLGSGQADNISVTPQEPAYGYFPDCASSTWIYYGRGWGCAWPATETCRMDFKEDGRTLTSVSFTYSR